MSEQTGVTAVTGDDGIVASAGEEADVAGVSGNGNGKKRKKFPIGTELLRQYAAGLGIPIGRAQKEMNELGFHIRK